MPIPRDSSAASGVGLPAGRTSFEGEGPEDRALVGYVSEGDGRALETLYARYGKACFSLARRILVDEQFAQDCVQEVFLVVWKDASRYDPTKGAFSTWLLSMTHHKAVDAVRREETLRRRRAGAGALDDAVSDAPAVDDQAWTTLRQERVRAVLDRLPAPQREALTLAYFGGYTQREIAGLTDTPLGTVKTRMLAGMARMKAGLEGFSHAATIETSGASA